MGVTQLIWMTVLALHCGLAVMWWWLMPGGFPSSSTEFWLNQVAPVVVLGILLTGLFARGRLSQALLPRVLAMIPVFWIAFAISARLLFLESFRSLWNAPFLVGAALVGLWIKQFRARLRPVWLVPLVVVPAAWAGWELPYSQRAPEPATKPAGAALDSAPAGPLERKLIRLTKNAQLHPEDGRLVIRRDQLVLNIQSMLSFANRSPDRCWISLAPDELNVPTVRKLTARAHDAAHWTFFYKDEDASVLDVAAREGAILVDARSRLSSPIFSSESSLAELTIQGHRKLSVSFSPIPKARFALPTAAAPARFAYVDAAGDFHVAESNSRQRGPFTELAVGHMEGGAPLALTLYDGDKAAFTVTLEDWAAQASTQLSPAAGWGIPVNAIELHRGGEAESSPALISLSLAETAIGHGKETVGHAAGVYRNRVTVTLPSP